MFGCRNRAAMWASCRKRCLAGRIAGQFRLEDLHGHPLGNCGIRGKIDLSHRPGRQQPFDLVAGMFSQFQRQPIEVGTIFRPEGAGTLLARVVKFVGEVRLLGCLEQPNETIVGRSGDPRGAGIALRKMHLDDGRPRRIQEALGKGHQVIGRRVR